MAGISEESEVGKAVSFTSDGLVIAGVLRSPVGAGPHPAMVFTGPLSGVKDQVVRVYAELLTAAGFVTLVFDHRNFGESEGTRRQHEDPQGKLADLQDAVSYLAEVPMVDADRIGLVGICLGGGYALKAAAFDPRIRAVGCVAGGFNSPLSFAAQMGAQAYREALAGLLQTRAHEPDRRIPAVALEGPATMGGAEPYAYYGTERGASACWRNELTHDSLWSLMTLDVLSYAPLVAPTPLLIVHGRSDDYCTPEGAQAAFDAAGEPKRIVWLDTTCHIDLYDVPEYVNRATEELGAHFGHYLAPRRLLSGCLRADSPDTR